jgi:hypothetical protein
VKQTYLQLAAKGKLKSRDEDDWNSVCTTAHYMFLREDKGMEQEKARRLAGMDRHKLRSSFGKC